MSDCDEKPWEQPHALSDEALTVRVMAETRAEAWPDRRMRDFARRVVALIDAHANDLADMRRNCEEFSKVYCHIAGLSKANTAAMYIIDAHDAAVDAAYAEGKADAKEHPEICICAAIQLKNAVGGTVVIRGHRHHDCIAAVRLRLSTSDSEADHDAVRLALHGSTQGFITSRNRFVGREEGLRLQLAAGLASARGEYGSGLFSEDLY